MSPTALRLSAIPLGLLAFTLRVAETLLVQPLTWHLGPSTARLVWLTSLLAVVVTPFGIFVLLGAARRQRPSQFILHQARFVVPASPAYGGSMAIMVMGVSGSFVPVERVPDGDSMRLAQVDFALPASAFFVGTFWVAALAFALIDRPQVHLSPDGFTILRLRLTTSIAWNELAPGGPPTPAKRFPRVLKVYRDLPPVVGRFPPREDIPAGLLHIEPAFLAAAVRHYVEHPEHRAGIGTAEELTRLKAALTASTTGSQSV
jgi:hypothetical protein